MKQPPITALLHHLRTTLSLAVLFGAATLASGQTNQILYQEDWGSAFYASNGVATLPNPAITAYGWTNVGGQYSGTYGAVAGSFDVNTGVVLSNHPAYYSSQVASDAGIMFTTSGAGSGTDGDTAFTSITPVAGLTLNVYSQVSAAAGSVTNFFAVMVGGVWYASATPMTNNPVAGGTVWGLNSLVYNPVKTNWNILTQIATAPITVGGNPAADLSGTIDGVGIVQTWVVNTTASPGFNYLNYQITAPIIPSATPVITGTGASSTNYTGGTASFAVSAVSTASLNYSWSLNGGAALGNGATGNGSTIFGATGSQITISNLTDSDAGTYTVSINGTPAATNSLTVIDRGPELLYAETFPFVGPVPYAQPASTVGWRSVIPTTGITNRLDNRGEVYAYETAARTMGFFTSTNLDTNGLSGVPFPATGIIQANSPFVSLRATYAAAQNPGNASTFFAVQMAGGAWFVSTSANQLTGVNAATNYVTYGLQFSPVASGWNQLTVPGSFTGNVTVGATATANLTGRITGVGLVFVFTGPALYLVDQVSIVTNSTPPIAPSFPSLPNVPYPQTVFEGGGAQFSFTEAGTLPFTNDWDLNQSGIFLTNGVQADGSIISGATTTQIVIQNAQMTGGYRGVVSNPATTNGVPPSTTDTGTFGLTMLTVNPPPLGLIYSESMPQYAVVTGNQSETNIGWTNIGTTPTILFHNGAATVGTFAGFSFNGSPTNTIHYASTTTDTGFSGLPFIAFDPANYPAGSLQFSANFSQGNAAYTNTAAYFAVRFGASNWYEFATPVIPTGGVVPLNGTYTPFSQMVSFSAGQWTALNLGTNNNILSVGSLNAQTLHGPITAAGILFQHVAPAGGDINFNAFSIQAIGSSGDNIIGGINVNAGPNGTALLTWIGNPAVKVQSSGSLINPNWQDVPNTLGNHMLTITTGPTPQYYRLAGLSVP